ncbi:MAG: glycosyltransferase [Candidatus Woesearchaeota archaeon]
MIITTYPIKKWKNFGKYYYKIDKGTIKIEKDTSILFFKGYLYPDLNMTLEDLFRFFTKKENLKKLKLFKGRYSGCFIDKKENVILIFNDQLGLNDLFYYYKKSQLIVSDKFTEFFKIKKFYITDLDQTALAEFMLYEHVLTDRTFIKDVKLLPYASVIKFDFDEKITLLKYWSFQYAPKKEFNSVKSLEQLSALFIQSVNRIKLLNQNKTFALGLSGGLDSRLVAKYALDAGIKIKPFVFGHKNSDAYIIAKKIAKELKLNVKELNIKDNFYYLKNEHINYDPMMNIMYTSYCSIKNDLPKADCMLTGFNGDNIFGSHIKKSDFNTNISIIQKIQKRYELKPHLEILSSEAKQMILDDLAGYQNLKLDDWNICEIFNFENRQLRFIKNSCSFDFYGKFENKTYSPFADIDLVEFVLKLPLKELKNSELYYDFFGKYLPDLAKIRPERVPYSIKNSNAIKFIKTALLRLKIFFLEKLDINLPIYKRINYRGALDWVTLFKQINFNYESIGINLNYLKDYRIKKLEDDFIGVRIKFHYLTIQNFIKRYIQKADSKNLSSPKISVIMSVYNDSKFVKQSIESILRQTFSDFEFIIINDCSKDNTLDIIKQFQKKDRRIKVINNKENIGLTKSLNKGLNIARGQYIARIDSDDWSALNRFEIQHAYLERNPDIFMIGSDCKLVFGKYILPSTGIVTGVDTIRIKSAKRNCMTHSSLMFRNNSSLRYREKFKYSQDYDLILNILSRGLNIDNLSDALVYFRINEKGISFSQSVIQQFFAKKAQEFYLQRVRRNGDNYESFNPDQELSRIDTVSNSTKNSSGVKFFIDTLVYYDKRKALKVLISHKNSLNILYLLKKILILILPKKLMKIRRDFLN